uniref:Acetylcholinesterase n=1 Tax=Strongyloides stercoralis TaxID=6248 RepID=A0A0K0E629_STRER
MLLLLVFILLQLEQLLIAAKTVKLRNGCYKGYLSKQFPNVYEFLGIPFAKPPVGRRRFRPPEPFDDYGMRRNRCFDAKIPANTCYFTRKYYGFPGQDEWESLGLSMSEDCLQLNMWVPKKPKGDVIVHIPGISYRSGSPSLPHFDGSVLAAHTSSIVVNINYRFGAFGFAYLGRKHRVPGNMGLLDQQMALKWIHKNIEAFGGNKTMITLVGHYTGGSSATAHLFSDGSRQYFRRVVALSGTIAHDWAYEKNKRVVCHNSRKLMRRLGCHRRSSRRQIKCMQRKPPHLIALEADRIYNLDQSILKYGFLPIDNDRLFFKGSIEEKLKNNDFKRDVDLVVGGISNEGSKSMVQYLDKSKYGCYFDHRKPINSSYNKCLINDKQYDNIVKLVGRDIPIKKEGFDKLKDIYSNITVHNNRDRVARMISDVAFYCDYIKFGKLLNERIYGKTYFYNIAKRISNNPWPKWMGPVHGYDLLYFFGHPYKEPSAYDKELLRDEEILSTQFMFTLSKFSKEGTMFKSWPQFETNSTLGVFIDGAIKKGSTFKSGNVSIKQCYDLFLLIKQYKAEKSSRLASDFLQSRSDEFFKDRFEITFN